MAERHCPKCGSPLIANPDFDGMTDCTACGAVFVPESAVIY